MRTLRLTLAVLALVSASAASALAGPRVVVEGTLEASLGHPKVKVQLRNGAYVLRGTPSAPNLGRMLGEALGPAFGRALRTPQAPAPQEVDFFTAYLDTGASASVLTRRTLDDFGAELDIRAVYHEFGLHGETQMGVSLPYSVALASSDGTLSGGEAPFVVRSEETLFEVNSATADALQTMVAGELNVIGMPFIRELVVEIDPAPMRQGGASVDPSTIARQLGGLSGGTLDLSGLSTMLQQVTLGPAVTVRDGGAPIRGYDIAIPLVYRDFARRQNPEDQGPKPDLADNPVLPGVVVRNVKKRARGDFLLDTGAATSFISTEIAEQLALIGPDGERLAPVAFRLPMSGISGRQTVAEGFVVSELVVQAKGKAVVFRDARVLVHDVAAKLDDGEVVVLDGIIGNNLLLPSVAGAGTGIPTGSYPGAFSRIWIDGPNQRLLLKRR